MYITLPDGSWLILGLIILFLIATNLGLWAAWKRKNHKNQANWLNKLSDSIRKPWQNEDAKLAELSKRVSELRNQDNAMNHKTDKTTNNLVPSK